MASTARRAARSALSASSRRHPTSARPSPPAPRFRFCPRHQQLKMSSAGHASPSLSRRQLHHWVRRLLSPSSHSPTPVSSSPAPASSSSPSDPSTPLPTLVPVVHHPLQQRIASLLSRLESSSSLPLSPSIDCCSPSRVTCCLSPSTWWWWASSTPPSRPSSTRSSTPPPLLSCQSDPCPPPPTSTSSAMAQLSLTPPPPRPSPHPPPPPPSPSTSSPPPCPGCAPSASSTPPAPTPCTALTRC